MHLDETFQEVQEKSSRGIKWVGIAELFIRIVQFGTSIALARLLFPQDFGLMSIVLVFLQMAYVIFDFGFSSALIQKKTITRQHMTTTFSTYLVSAFLFTILIVLLARRIADFFGHPVLAGMLKTLTVIFFLYSLSALPKIQLMRELKFKQLSRFQIISVAVYSLTAIYFAWKGYGAWCFVFGSLAEQLTITALLFWYTRWRPGIQWQWPIFKELLNFGGNVLGTRIVGYLNANAPYFIIGKILGATLLGFYSLAYQLIDYPVQRITKNVLKVMFPAFSRLQDDPVHYRQLYLRTLYYTTLVTFPIFAGLVLIAPEFVRFVYGHKWEAAIVPLKILAVVGLTRSLWTTASVVFLSRGKPHIEFRINLGFALVLVPALLLATRFSIKGVALALATVLLAFYGIALINAMRIVDITPGDVWNALRIPVQGIVGFTVLGFILKHFLIHRWTDAAILAFLIGISMITYGLLVYRSDRQIVSKLIRFIGQ
ncbi:MAG: lipopolysaccharide biosynthesis protein [Calditrichaeota bacterium]|nr:lipopolysaccharide biosynthesis protein [Calditrichota bacterium]